MKTKEIVKAIEALESDRGISKEIVIESLVEALEKAYRKNFPSDIQAEIQVRAFVDSTTGNIRLFHIKDIVEEVLDDELEIALDEAVEFRPDAILGEKIEIEVQTDDFGRLAAVQAKQILRQKIREAEKQIVFEAFADKKDDIITGIVDRVESKFAIINLGKTGALLPMQEQIPGEHLRENEHIRVYVLEVDKTSKGAQVVVSRATPQLVKRLFELEVPEIFEGTVEIKSIVREAGDRTKMSVVAHDLEIDAIGACIGPKGGRVQKVVEQLNNEKIDIIEYSSDPVVYISNALSPSKVTSVMVAADGSTNAVVVVPDNQLSLAIGKRGQNARLAVRLTGWKIDIKSESDAAAQGFEYIANVGKPSFEPTIEPSYEDIFVEEVIEQEPVIIEEVVEEEEVLPTMEELLNEEKVVEVKEVKVEPLLPIYTEEELAAMELEEVEDDDDEDDIDYDEYDQYYED